MGVALNSAQLGGKHPAARPMKGFHGAGVLEIIEDFDGDTYRAIYTVKFEDVVYMLHAFQKKSEERDRNTEERFRSSESALQIRRADL
ncbi:MAG: type II toxin-antitoxin system RelE/ParE family toxin [Candidatus Binataceae bacterium]